MNEGGHACDAHLRDVSLPKEILADYVRIPRTLKILFTFCGTWACTLCLNGFVSKPKKVKGGSDLVHEKSQVAVVAAIVHSRSGKTRLALSSKGRNWDVLHEGHLKEICPCNDWQNERSLAESVLITNGKSVCW